MGSLKIVMAIGIIVVINTFLVASVMMDNNAKQQLMQIQLYKDLQSSRRKQLYDSMQSLDSLKGALLTQIELEKEQQQVAKISKEIMAQAPKTVPKLVKKIITTPATYDTVASFTTTYGAPSNNAVTGAAVEPITQPVAQPPPMVQPPPVVSPPPVVTPPPAPPPVVTPPPVTRAS